MTQATVATTIPLVVDAAGAFAERRVRRDERSGTPASGCRLGWQRTTHDSEATISSTAQPLRASGALVAVRASVLGTVVLATAAISHVAAGGLLPHPGVLVLLLAGCVMLAAHHVRSRASATRLVTVAVVGQTVLHGLLSLLAGHQALPRQPLPAPVAHSHDHVHEHGHGQAHSLPALDHLVADLAEQGPLMVLAHAAGAAALGWWLAVGESALWHLLLVAAGEVGAVLVLTRAQVAARAGVLGVRESARQLVVPAPVLLPLSETLPHRLVSRRGPPLLRAA